MLKRAFLTCLVVGAIVSASSVMMPASAQAAGEGQPTDWGRFYYYPYVYYPQNFQRPLPEYDHMYYRYPPSRQIPVYNKSWHNFYPTERPYHKGVHFILDVF
jgi:hypothetical protein